MVAARDLGDDRCFLTRVNEGRARSAPGGLEYARDVDGNGGLGVKRRTIFWIVVALCALVVFAVGAAMLYSLFNEEVAASSEPLAYLTVFALVFCDAIIPIFPGETTLNTASVLAAQGTLEIGLVIVAGALGAILGDSALYWLTRTGPKKLKIRLEASSQKDERVAKGIALLNRSGPLLIAFGRFVPGVRFAVNVSMGLIEYPYRRFLLFSAIGGALWSTYTCLLAYWVGSALADFPVASIVISGLITTALIGAAYWLDRRRRRRDGATPPSGIEAVPGQ
jgi:membrane-associated protein